MSEEKTITLSMDREESLLRGYIPLNALIVSGKDKIEKIDFAGNGYLTDAALHLLNKNSSNKDIFDQLKHVDLMGCNLVTDHGIQALVQCIQNSTLLTQINLDGCELLTENTFSMMKKLISTRQGKLQCNMRATSVALQANMCRSMNNLGCQPLKSGKDFLHGNILIVPHPSMTTSVAEYIYSGKVVEKSSGFFKSDLKVDDWTMSVTEINPSSCLLDSMESMGSGQVMIPFDASFDPKEITKHVRTTISRVVAKEPVWQEWRGSKQEIPFQAIQSTVPFMDVYKVVGLDLLDQPDGSKNIRNISLSDSMIGVFVSRERFTRSNSYFEVTVGIEGDSGKSGALIGCLYDVLYSENNPMDSSSDVGGMVDGFEVASGQKVVGFGIDGEWESEYVPGSDAEFYFTEDGVKQPPKNPDEKLKPNGSMYPIVSVLGESICTAKLPPLVEAPEELKSKWTKENRWIERGRACDILVDKEGRMRYCRNYASGSMRGIFLGLRAPDNYSFSVVIEELSPDTNFSIGIAGESLVSLVASGKGNILYSLVFETIKSGEVSVKCEKVKGTAEKEIIEQIKELKVGDEIKVDCKVVNSEKVKTDMDMTFYHNNKQVFSSVVSFDFKAKPARLVPYVGIKTKDVVLRLKNYMPTYRRPAPYKDKITLGRCHYMNVMDNGECHFKVPDHFPNDGKVYGWFMGKTPFNKDLLEFTVEVMELDINKLFGIGVTEPNFVESHSFIGWKQDQLGYHADNGKYYHNDGTGSDKGYKGGPIDSKIIEGDTVKLKVVPADHLTPLLFDEEGVLQPHQKLLIQFYKNGELMYEIPHEFHNEAMYPAFSTRNSVVKIHNFYPETAALLEKTFSMNQKNEEKPNEKEKPEEPPQDLFKGTEFLVVGVTNGSSDPAGKLQILKQQIEQIDKSNFQEMNNVATAISEMEQDLTSMDLQDQQRYGQLCGIYDNMMNFVNNIKDRVRYLPLTLNAEPDKLKDGRDKILTELVKAETRLKALQPLRYKEYVLVEGAGKNEQFTDEILKTLSAEKILEFSKIFTHYLKDLSNTNGRSLMSILKLMQSRGQLLLLDIGSDKIIVDIEYMIHLEANLWQLLPADLIKINTTVTCIGDSSHVWEHKSVETKILGEIPGAGDKEDKKKVLWLLLEKSLGLIRVPCLRTKPEEEHSVFVIQQNVSSPPQPLNDYWTPSKDSTNYVVMKQKYTFPLGLPDYILPLIISNTNKFGHMIVMSGGGVVYQNGAVQTVIIKEEIHGMDTIVLESWCYMPNLDTLDDSRMSKLTPSYVKDYTWNIFCIFTDIVDDLLQRSRIVPMVTKDFPKDLVNISVGCKHTWVNNADCSVVQSVCTMCNRCCGNREDCPWNGIMGEYLRQSGCCADTSGCQGCGICIPCAQELWDIRSRLRPYGNAITEIELNIAEKTRILKPGEESKQKLRDPLKESVMPLDPFIFNEIEFTNLSSENKLICLREESDGTILKAFPGVAASVKDLNTANLPGKLPNLLSNGDQIKLKITDPLGASLLPSEESKKGTDRLQIEPQYFASIGREVKVIHESGIVVYDSPSTAIPVGQLIAVRPMTKEFDNFSIRVLEVGKSSTIAMGLAPQNYAPNRQPGWNSQSIGYHADDGGIYLESGYATRKTQKCQVGDIMSFYIDFAKNKGFFRKNGEKMIELNLNFNKLACYPTIGLHSHGEAVEILEKEFWIPKTEQESNYTPPAYATYKYGNLWISPGDKVPLTRLKDNKLTGWIILHNPIKDPVGFKVRVEGAKDLQFFGIIDNKKNWLKDLIIENDTVVNEVIVEWTSLEPGRTYKIDEMKTFFGESEEQVNQSSHLHRLPVEIRNTTDAIETLQTVSSGPPRDKKSLCLSVYRNMKLVDEYWLKYGNYNVSVEASNKKAKFLLKYPKCQSFTYPRGFQKGMKFVIYLDSEKAFAECVVVEVYPGGKSLALEYSPKDRTSNLTVCVMTTSSAFSFSEYDNDQSVVIPYETRNTPSNLTRTFVNAPPYLLSEGAKKALPALYPEWKANMLKSMADCSQVFTRLTVQEHNIAQAAKNLMHWYPESYNGHLFTFLPSQLTQSKLVYPQPEQMFSNVSVHRLCFAENELLLSSGYHDQTLFEMPLKLALHYVDIPGIPPDKSLPVDVLFGEGLNVWTYVALIATKLYLPSYKKMIPDDSGKFSREQIEQVLYNMLQTYTSLCGIYAASWGGIQYSQMSEVRDVRRAIQHEDKYLVQLTQAQQFDPHVLIQKGDFAICKAHLMNYGISDNENLYFKDEVEFKYQFFEPYIDHVTLFLWCHEELKQLPEDFFKRFANLIHFKLGEYGTIMSKFKKLPEGIGSAKKLRYVEIYDVAMEKLPDDIFMGKNVETLLCSNLPVKTLPTQWPTESKLSKLSLCGLLIDKLPEEIGQLSELKEFDLCRNPITDLPGALQKLKKLTFLSLQGCPLLILEGKRTSVRTTHPQFEHWYSQNPYIRYKLGFNDKDKLFGVFDANHNGSLDEEEIAALNLEFFFKVPRLGITDINDEVTGGIPPVVFNLKSLVELHLEYNAITMVPQAINNLSNLKLLGLSHNPLLESLPGSLGHLPNIQKISLTSCPMLRTPPAEIVGRGFQSVKAYLKRLAGGFTECRRTKLMVVGLGGAGKTSLLRALMSDKKKTQGTEKEIPTDGIDIVPWTVSNSEGQEVTYSTWDFAGQAVYYNTHQFFLSKRAVYLLLWSMRQGYEHAGLDFWLSSICCHAPGTPIIVVGTQCDLIPKAEIPEKELIERYPQIASFHRVSAIEGTGIEALQNNLLDVTLQQGYMGEKIPQVWLNFERRIIAERFTKKNYIKWEVARSYAMEQGIYDEKDVRMAIQLLHDLGTVQYFDNDFLRDYVVINPQWIVNVMACVVSAQDSPIQKNNGRFLHSDIPTVWKEYDVDLHEWLLRLTEDFDLTFPLPKEPVNIVPCLLPGEPPEDLKWPSVKDQEGVRETKMVYRFTYLPSGLFNRAQVRLFQFSDGKMVWKKGSLLSKNKHLALIKQADNKELVVFVQGPRPENVLFLIHEVFESIIEESFNGVSYDMFLPCPDCVTKEGALEPDLLNAKLIQRAIDMKAPFIQCYKYFHWISMAQLQEKLPADTKEVADFDIQLQQSIVALQELNNDLVVDTAILYSMADVPGPGETDKLPPKLIYEDIIKWGYTCWFSEDMNNVSAVDMTAAIKNCKVLIALVSDEFERDAKCRDLFLYAKDTMNKDVITIVLGESMEWENKDLGMKIGKQERKLMAKTKARYEVEGGRRTEFKEWLTEKILLLSQEDTLLPDVFVSYCWSNSKSAAEKSGRINPDSLGWGDPRQMKAVLQKQGINCWIDVENVGKDKKGIFADMAAGIRNSKMMLAFISDEYAESVNCMMELRFGIINIELPLVAVAVGTKAGWKQTEVAMLLRRAHANEVSLQNENPEGINVMVKYVQDMLQKEKLSGSKKKNKKKTQEAVDLLKKGMESKKETKTSSVAYQEEVELIQRKFMRHILGSIIAVDTMPLPRLIVVDFVKSGKQKNDEGRDSKIGSKSRKMLRPKTATKSRDRLQVDDDVLNDEEDDWTKESLCIRLLCEHEGGWHVCEEMYPLAFRTRDQMEQFLTKASPYLYRIYTILKQGPIKLKCFGQGKGEAFQKWILQESEENLDFIGSMMHLRSHLDTEEATDFVSCLARCRLPSGKIVWLCEKHQHEEHVAKLSIDSRGSSHNYISVLFNEDKFLLEQLEKSEEYKRRKAIKSNKVAPNLPKPPPIPMFMPAQPIPVPEPDKKPTPKSSPRASPRSSPVPPKTDDKSKAKSETVDKDVNEDKPLLKVNDLIVDKQVLPEDKDKKKTNKPDLKTEEREANVDKNDVDITKTENLIKNDAELEEGNNEDIPKKTDDNKEEVQGENKKGKDNIIPEEKREDVILAQEDVMKISGTKTKQRKKSKDINDDSAKDKIKKMILHSDSKAMMKAMRKPVRSVSQKAFGIQVSDMKSLQRKQSSNNFSSVMRGSNVKRLHSEGSQKDESSSANSRTSSQGSSVQLDSMLQISTVNKTKTDGNEAENVLSKSQPGKVSSKSNDASKEDVFPLDRVRPKKIKVQPKRSISEGHNPRQNMTATGIGMGTVQSSSMPLPERQGSQACVLQ